MLGYMLDALDVLLRLRRSNLAHRVPLVGRHRRPGQFRDAPRFFGRRHFCRNPGDRIGRCRTLIYMILVYSFGSASSATSTGIWSLLAWRGSSVSDSAANGRPEQS